MTGWLSAGLLVSLVFGHVAVAISGISTLMSPESQVVAIGEEFRFVCRSMNIPAREVQRQRHELYRLTGSGQRRPVGPDAAARCSERSVPEDLPWATMTTTFTLNASRDGESAAGTYGCLLLGSKRAFPAKVKPKLRVEEVTVEVCTEPSLRLELVRSESSDGIVVRAVGTRCQSGELTWVLDGRRVPRASVAPAPGQAVENTDDALEIRGAAADDCRPARLCNATAIFTYIDHGRLKRALLSTQIEDCCVSGEIGAGSGETDAEDILTSLGEEHGMPPVGQDFDQSRPNPLDLLHITRQAELDRAELERAVLTLQRDVLQLRKQALPMRIKLLQRLTGGDASPSNDELVEDLL